MCALQLIRKKIRASEMPGRRMSSARSSSAAPAPLSIADDAPVLALALVPRPALTDELENIIALSSHVNEEMDELQLIHYGVSSSALDDLVLASLPETYIHKDGELYEQLLDVSCFAASLTDGNALEWYNKIS